MAVRAAIIASLRERLNHITAEPERLSLLCRLCDELAAYRPEEALAELPESIRLAQSLHKQEEHAWLLRLRGDCRLRLGRVTEACASYVRSVTIYTSIGAVEEAVTVGLAHAEAAINNGAWVEGVAAYEGVLALYAGEENYRGMIAVLKSLGDLHEHLNDDARAFDYFLQGLKIAERLEDPVSIGSACSDLGIICVRLGRHDQAFYYFSRAVDEFRRAQRPLLEVPALVNLAALHAEQENLESAQDYLVKAHVIYDLLNNKEGLATTFMNAGALYERSKGPESALAFYMKAHDLFEELSDNAGRAAALLGIGNVHRTAGRNHDAVWFLEHALQAARNAADRERESQCLELLAHSHEGLGNHAEALRHLWKYLELQRALTDGEQQKIVAEMQVRFDLERAEKEREIWKLKSERLEGEMHRKGAELTALTLQLVEKHRFIEDLLKKIESIEGNGAEDMKPIAREISNQIRQSVNSDDDWEVFKEQFHLVYPDLLHRIAARWPKLTRVQLRTCALIITGLSIGEIAALLRVERRTVETNRYRIRLALGIDSKVNLATFLQGV